MPNYITLLRYTPQGMSKINASPSRLDAAKKAAEKEKGKIEAWYLTMGRYDAVFNFQTKRRVPDLRCQWVRSETFRTETLKAFPESDYRKIVTSL